MQRKRNSDDGISVYEMYIGDIRKYSPIDDIKTREYILQYRNGTGKEKSVAKERIIGGHQRFVLSVANKFVKGNNIMDLISEGNIGLMNAIDKYDVESNVKFTTYAMYWIRKEIINYITLKEPMISPANAIKLSAYIPKIKQEFWGKNQRNATVDELYDILVNDYGFTFVNLKDIEPYQNVSIDEKYNEDEDGQEFMESSAYTSRTATCNIDGSVRKNDAKAIINMMIGSLSDRDAYILKCLYGIDCESKSMDTIASEVGLSHERIRQIATGTISRLGKMYGRMRNEY